MNLNENKKYFENDNTNKPIMKEFIVHHNIFEIEK